MVSQTSQQQSIPNGRIVIASHVSWELIQKYKEVRANVLCQEEDVNGQQGLVRSRSDLVHRHHEHKDVENIQKAEKEHKRSCEILEEKKAVLKELRSKFLDIDRKIDSLIIDCGRTWTLSITSDMCRQLPRELRDMIYSFYLDEEMEHGNWEIRVFSTKAKYAPREAPACYFCDYEVFESILGQQVFEEVFEKHMAICKKKGIPADDEEEQIAQYLGLT